MSETWIKEWCPQCNVINWLCLPEGDCATMDIEGLKCNKCGYIKYFGSTNRNKCDKFDRIRIKNKYDKA